MFEKIKGIIFDLDGILTDTSSYHTQAWIKTVEEEGIPYDKCLDELIRGVPREESLRLILKYAQENLGFAVEYSKEEFINLLNKKNNYYIESLDKIRNCDFLPGARSILEYLKYAKYKIAIGSSSKNTEKVVEKLNITRIVDTISSGNSMLNGKLVRGKPEPDIFLHAAAGLNLNPENCVVIEDAVSGVQASKRAGMKSIGIGPESRFREENLKPDIRFDNMENLNEKKQELFSGNF
jgi:kojibiose phosphorylase